MQIESVDSITLKHWLDSGQAVLIDVREPSEHKTISITPSHNVPKSKVTLETLPEHVGKKLVFHCLSGIRSKMACKKILKKDGALEVYNLEGGIKKWRFMGLPTDVQDPSFAFEEVIIIYITIFLLIAIGVLLFL